MSRLAELEATLVRIDGRLDAIAGGSTEPDDADLAEYATLSEERDAAERAVVDERTRVRQRLHLGSEWKPPQHAIEQGAAILAGQPRDYFRLFGAPARSEWKPGEFLNIALRGLHDPRITFFAAQGESEGASGGLMVPQELARLVLDRALHQSIVMSRAQISPMVSKTKVVAGFAGTDQSQNLYGFSWAWLPEHAEATIGTGAIRAILLNAHVLGGYTAASLELIADAVGFEAQLMDALGRSAAEELDSVFISGTGVGQPLGYLKASSLLVIPKETTQAAGSILTENVLKMLSHSTAPATSVFVGNPSILPMVGQLVINAGAQTISSTLAIQGAEGAWTLGGRPLLLTHRAPILGQQGDLTLCDFSAYIVGLRANVGIESSPAPGFTRREQTFRCLVRCDGQPSSNTLYLGQDGRQYSPFVTLAVRA